MAVDVTILTAVGSPLFMAAAGVENRVDSVWDRAAYLLQAVGQYIIFEQVRIHCRGRQIHMTDLTCRRFSVKEGKASDGQEGKPDR
jgi:hypothetical protein